MISFTRVKSVTQRLIGITQEKYKQNIIELEKITVYSFNDHVEGCKRFNQVGDGEGILQSIFEKKKASFNEVMDTLILLQNYIEISYLRMIV